MRIQSCQENQIREAVASFTANHMSVTPDSVFVHADQQSIVITLHGITSPAEKEYSRDKTSRVILEGFYDDVFEANSYILESILENIIGQRIVHSKLSVDPDSDSGVIMLTIAK